MYTLIEKLFSFVLFHNIIHLIINFTSEYKKINLLFNMMKDND
jgi:hypothetical protein